MDKFGHHLFIDLLQPIMSLLTNRVSPKTPEYYASLEMTNNQQVFQSTSSITAPSMIFSFLVATIHIIASSHIFGWYRLAATPEADTAQRRKGEENTAVF